MTFINSSPMDKMAAILADNKFKCIFLNENDRILIRISLKCVPMSPIDNKPVLVQVMAWRQKGDKPLPELMLIKFTDAYMQYWGRWVNSLWPNDAIWDRDLGQHWLRRKACCLMAPSYYLNQCWLITNGAISQEVSRYSFENWAWKIQGLGHLQVEWWQNSGSIYL